MRVWDLKAGGSRPALAGHGRPVWSVALTPDGARAVSGGGDGTVRVWDLRPPGRAGQAHRPHRRGVRGGAHPGRSPCGQRRRRWHGAGVGPEARPGGDRLTGHIGWVCVGGGHAGRDPRGQRRRGYVSAGLGPGRRTRAGRPHRPSLGQVFSVAVTPDGSQGGQRRRRRHGAGLGPGPPAAEASPAISAGCGRWRSRRTAPARSPAAGRDGAGLGPGHRREQAALTGARATGLGRWRSRPDGARAVSGGSDGMVRVWDLATGWRADRLGRSHPSGVVGGGHRGRSHGGQRRRRWHGAGLGPGRLAASGRSSPAHGGGVVRGGGHPDGARAVSGGADGTVRVWDLTDRPGAGGPARPAGLGVVGGRHRGRDPRGIRRRGRDSAGVGPKGRPGAGRPDRPCRPGVHGGGHAGRGVRGKRGRGRLGTAVEPGRRVANWPDGSASTPSSG